MSEDVRIVEMENIDDVWIAQRFEQEHVVVVVPLGTGGDDRICGRSLANRGG
jgi:hypothetical protein